VNCADEELVPPPQAPDAADPRLRRMLTELAGVWHRYRSRAWRTPLVRRITSGELTIDEYCRWMGCWIPQVREGTRWMRTAASHLGPPYDTLAPLIEAHAGDEQFDYNMLFEDYRAAGGPVGSLDELRRNAGGEALNTYMHALAQRPNPVDLLGAIYVIEGTGQRIIPALLPMLRRQLALPERAFRFLSYHGENDPHHLARWLHGVEQVLALSSADPVEDRIVATAEATAELYLLQLGHAL
jgi:3-oxoacyl-[acyl-carrier-protein] synthase-3